MATVAVCTLQERSWGDVFDVIDRVVTEVNAEVPATTVMPVQADSVAADVATLVTDFNALLAKLKAAGLMASS
ncbi:hypothetical protein D3C85_1390390 [compost metagenome]